MTKKIRVGNIFIGGGEPISIQSMTNTNTADVKSTVNQIIKLQDAGCEIVRVAVPDMDSAKAIADIKKEISIPIVADIHFHYELAIESVKSGADKLRINPGNIGESWKVKEVAKITKEHNIPIRIGVNAGSISRRILDKYNGATPIAMVESAREEIRILEDLDFTDIVVSLKASDIRRTIEANHLFRKEFDYPIHLGITEAGTQFSGAIRSAIGIGALLLEGIGDTIRVSLSGDPVNEIKVAKEILKSTGVRNDWITIISCPTCGRCEIDVSKIAQELESKIGNIKKNLVIAIMGCEVNGPGEAKESDIGIAGTNDGCVLYIKGKAIRRLKPDKIFSCLLDKIDKMLGN